MWWRSASALPLLLALTAPLGCASGDPPHARPATASPAAALATYTVAQAERGERVFGDRCTWCHAAAQFSGPIFELTWMAEPVGHLFEHISTAMPEDDPGSLTPEEYAAIVAYLMRLNGVPPGDRELPADADSLRAARWRVPAEDGQ